MSAKMEKLEHNMAKFTIEVPVEEFEKAVDSAYKKNKNKISIPGFRKGKVPRQMIEKMYGKDFFYGDAANIIIPEVWEKTYDECEEDIVSSPEIDVVQLEAGKPFIFTAEAALNPEAKIGKYAGVEIEKIDSEVSDEELEAAINKERYEQARMVSVEREVRDGDITIIDYEGFVDGEAFEGGKGENHSLTIGSGSFIPGFEDQIIGHNAGEEFSIEVKFPEDYHSEELKGADAVFNVKIHTIKSEVLPELDDEFAKDVSEFDTLEEYKADIRKHQEEQAEKDAKTMFEGETVRVVCENTEIEIPDAMIENEIDNMLQEQNMRMRQSGIDMEMYLKYMGQSMDQFRDSMRPMASVRVKSALVIEKIKDEIKPEVTEDEINEELEVMAKSYNMEVEELKKALGDNTEFVKENIGARKTVEFLTEKAIKTEPKPAEEEKKDEE